MCATCGCGVAAEHGHEHGEHGHDGHEHGDHGHEQGHELARSSRVLALELDVLAENRRHAERNRRELGARGIRALNLVSSPGAGKTSLLTRTIADLRGREAIAVIEGDQQTRRDAERILAAGAAAVQINTGKRCHLDAHGVGHALDELAPPAGSLLFIENVGNLVCPADFDLGEARRVLLLSVAEGDDKPLKYPNLFATAQLLVVTKIDLLPHVDFDVERCIAYARGLQPSLEAITLSAKTGEGLARWYDYLANVHA
jgi:hydrogenase nickel incorporation protein HypB